MKLRNKIKDTIALKLWLFCFRLINWSALGSCVRNEKKTERNEVASVLRHRAIPQLRNNLLWIRLAGRRNKRSQRKSFALWPGHVCSVVHYRRLYRCMRFFLFSKSIIITWCVCALCLCPMTCWVADLWSTLLWTFSWHFCLKLFKQWPKRNV